MRLTNEQREIVHKEVAAVFGCGAIARLFGSRVDDAARGGDIDLHIEADGSPEQLLDRELKLYARLSRKLGERRSISSSMRKIRRCVPSIGTPSIPVLHYECADGRQGRIGVSAQTCGSRAHHLLKCTPTIPTSVAMRSIGLGAAPYSIG